MSTTPISGTSLGFANFDSQRILNWVVEIKSWTISMVPISVEFFDLILGRQGKFASSIVTAHASQSYSVDVILIAM